LLALRAAFQRAIMFVFGPVLRSPRRRPGRGARRLMLWTRRDRVVTVPSAIAVPQTFCERDYDALLQALSSPGPKLLDLSAARSIRLDLFTALASRWTPNPELVPRLAIVLRFEHWAVLRETASFQLAPLHARGVEAAIFYREQTLADRLLPWFERGEATHNVAAVLCTLRRWQPSPLSPVVLEAVAALVNEAVAGGAPASYIVELASISLASGANVQSLRFAREALMQLGEVASVQRFEALRVLGLALMSEGKVVGATGILDGAIAMAISIGAMEDAADLLRRLGSGELDRGELSRAELRFRTAIELLRPSRSETLASLHHCLALTLLAQGHDGAEVHAAIALASRPDSESPGAQMDLELLGNIRSGRGLAS
ncbi:MAG: hypothetical protein ABIY55_23660, partial [Kofleriaceae bacterium]